MLEIVFEYFRRIVRTVDDIEKNIAELCREKGLKSHLEINRVVKDKLDEEGDGKIMNMIFGLKEIERVKES